MLITASCSAADEALSQPHHRKRIRARHRRGGQAAAAICMHWSRLYHTCGCRHRHSRQTGSVYARVQLDVHQLPVLHNGINQPGLAIEHGAVIGQAVSKVVFAANDTLRGIP